MNTHFDTASTLFAIDADSSTVAEAWASSPLGEPDDAFTGCVVDESVDDGRTFAENAMIGGAVVLAVASCATMGWILFGFHPDTDVVPVPAQPAVVITPDVQTPPTVVPAQAPRSAVVEVPAPAPRSVVVNVPAQEPVKNAPAPAPQDPQVPPSAPPEDPEDPKPPLVVDDFTAPEPPSDPEPPSFLPDLPLTLPEPTPDPKPPIFAPPLKAGS